jgi:RNA polymerase sigma factor (sigma-70 family)
MLIESVTGRNMTRENSIGEDSLFAWHQSLREGSNRATEKLWQKYFERMVRVARNKLGNTRRAAADEEDIALSAFKSFCRAFQDGRFQLRDSSSNLWPLLVTLTINKAIDHLRRENRKKRRPQQNDNDGEPRRFTVATAEALNNLVANEPSPELAAAAEESFEQLLAALDASGDPSLRRIVLDAIAGMSTAEIAGELNCTPRTIQRKLQTIRTVWETLNPLAIRKTNRAIKMPLTGWGRKASCGSTWFAIGWRLRGNQASLRRWPIWSGWLIRSRTQIEM